MKTVQPDYHYHLKTASNPSISPDGSSAAFVVHRFEPGAFEASTDVFICNMADGSNKNQITNTGTASKPVWDPSGSKLAYLDNDDSGVKQIYVWSEETASSDAITDRIVNIDAFSWSLDGNKIAFRALVPGEDELRLIEAGNDSPQIRTARRIRYQQDGVGWRGDSFYHLFIHDLDSNQITQITDGEGDDGPPIWSPDGKRIAFISDRNDARDTISKTELFVCDTDGSNLEVWSSQMFMVESVAWSPDSRKIAVTGGQTRTEVGGYGLTTQSSVYVLEPGSKPVKLTDDSIRPQANGTGFPVTADSPTIAWKNDTGIILGADSRGQSHLAVANPEHPGEFRLVTDGWQITELNIGVVSDDVLVCTSSPTSHGELFRVDLNSGAATQITNLNSEFFSDHTVATLEKFTITRENFDIESRVWFPSGFDPRNRYPLLLDVHGGPHSAFYDSFYPIHQVAAGAGYVVVAPNPRGSSTYGLKFATAVHSDWGLGDYEDVMAAMEEVASREYIDETRVVIHGSSYGGFMSSWAVGHTNRFNAAVIAAPVTNLSSFYGTSDIGVNFTETQLGGERFDSREKYEFHSPLTYARNVETPVLLLHGEDDIRVPIEQAEQYFVALKRHGKEVEFVRLPKTSHGIFRAKHPMIRMEYFRRMLAWFEKHNSDS